MRDVYITLGFFAWFNLCLCGWTLLGYRCLLAALHMNEPGSGGECE